MIWLNEEVLDNYLRWLDSIDEQLEISLEMLEKYTVQNQNNGFIDDPKINENKLIKISEE